MSLREVTREVLRWGASHGHSHSKEFQTGRDALPGMLLVLRRILGRSSLRSRLAAMAWTQSRRRLDRIGNCGKAAEDRAEGPLAGSIAMGYSSPVIAAGKVYLSDAELKKPMVRERVQCLEADSGKVRWTHSYEHTVPDWFFTEEQGRGPGATPIVRKRKVYALDLFGNLVCLDTRHGKVVWKKNLKEEFQMKETSVDASPLIEGDLLILMLGGKGERELWLSIGIPDAKSGGRWMKRSRGVHPS